MDFQMSPPLVPFRPRIMSSQPKRDDQTATLQERDAAAPITATEVATLMSAVLDERDKAAPTPGDQPLLTPRQWKAAGAILTTFAAIVGGSGYAGVATLTSAEVATQDEANRKVVREELDRVIMKVDARVDADRAEFKEQIGVIKGDMRDTKESVSRIESYILILKDRERRK